MNRPHHSLSTIGTIALLAGATLSPLGCSRVSNLADAVTRTSPKPTPAPGLPKPAHGVESTPAAHTNSVAPAHTPHVTTTTTVATASPTSPSSPAAVNPYPYSSFPDAPRGDASPAEPMGSSPLQRVTFSPVGADFDPVITPDGTKLVFASTQHRHTSDIYIKHIDSEVVTQLTSDPHDDVMPAVSPDGTKVAFASNRGGNWDIYVVPFTGGQAIRVSNDPSDELHPTWSPQGEHLAFCRMGEVSGRWELWTTSVPNTAVSHFLGYGMFPQWCPVAATGAGGADRILFQVGRERGARTFGVWTLDIKDNHTSNATQLASNPTSALINPTWSPDGLRIAYSEVPIPRDPSGAPDSRLAIDARPTSARLWVQNVDGTGKVQLTDSSAIALLPSWGPGNRLVFMSPRRELENIWSMDLNQVVAAMDSTSSPGAKAPLTQKPAQPAGPENTPQATAAAEEPTEMTPPGTQNR
ncbi:MAG: DPP IV N-terminal domain-containing protein [Planctomycetota bacterium]